jgi:hypothetical protein
MADSKKKQKKQIASAIVRPSSDVKIPEAEVRRIADMIRWREFWGSQLLKDPRRIF